MEFKRERKMREEKEIGVIAKRFALCETGCVCVCLWG